MNATTTPLTTPRAAGAEAAPPGRLHEVADGVLMYEQAPGGWCLSNAGVLVGDGTVTLIDTASTVARAAALRSAVAPFGPVQVVVNTHFHGDHTFGNALFRPTATIVAHELTRTEIAEAGLGLTHLWPDVEWGDVELALPTLTYTDRLTLHVGERRVELLHHGPAHTTNDTLVWVPDVRVLFTGDVVLSGATPFTLMGSVAGSLLTLDRIRELDPATLVTGHGPLCGPEAIDVTERYLRRIQRIAAEGAAAGLTPLEAAREHGPGEFADLIDAERLVGTLHRAYAELEPGAWGRPLDVIGAFGDMVQYNGGVLPTCLA